jgi:hypothetical protein
VRKLLSINLVTILSPLVLAKIDEFPDFELEHWKLIVQQCIEGDFWPESTLLARNHANNCRTLRLIGIVLAEVKVDVGELVLLWTSALDGLR